AKPRDLHAFAVGDLDQRLAGARLDLAAIELEADGGGVDLRQFGAGDGIHLVLPGVGCRGSAARSPRPTGDGVGARRGSASRSPRPTGDGAGTRRGSAARSPRPTERMRGL